MGLAGWRFPGRPTVADVISAAAALALRACTARPTSAQLPNNPSEMSALCGPMFANSEPVAWAPWQPDEHLNVSQTSPHDAWVAHASSEAGTSQSESELWGVDPDTARLGDESWFNTNESSYSTEPLAMPLGQEEPQRAPFTLSFEPSSVPGRLPLHPTCREIDDAESTEREDSEDSDVDASIRCPNCGEVKGSKGTWCRSPSCAKRRETLAKAQIRKVDSKTVFQYDEPAYRTPPVPEPEEVVEREKPAEVKAAAAPPAPPAHASRAGAWSGGRGRSRGRSLAELAGEEGGSGRPASRGRSLAELAGEEPGLVGRGGRAGQRASGGRW